MRSMRMTNGGTKLGVRPFSTRFIASIFILLSSCQYPAKIPVEDTLATMGIRATADFLELSLCQQVTTMVEAGAHDINIDHALTAVPNWMSQSISGFPKAEIAGCIVEAGDDILEHLNRLDDQLINSYRIHALVYETRDLGLISEPAIMEFINKAVCSKYLLYSGSIWSVYQAETHETVNCEQ